MQSEYRAIALCAIGLETILKRELRQLQLTIQHKQAGMLVFRGSLSDIFRANLRLRTAERVLLELLHTEVSNFDDLFAAIQTIQWQQFFAKEDSLIIERVRIRGNSGGAIRSQVTCQKVVHKAIYQYLSKYYRLQHLPESGKRHSLRIYIENHAEHNKHKSTCQIALDCSGAALHRRGYRQFTGLAPLKETIAAGFILLCHWKRKQVFFDAFCGSGTLAIEAALYGLDIAPGLQRKFAMENFPCVDSKLLAELRQAEQQKALENLADGMNLAIFACDCDPQMLEGAKANALRAGLSKYIHFQQNLAQRCMPPAEKGLLLSNPPYGERLSDSTAVQKLYHQLGELCRGPFADWAIGFVSNRPDFEYDFAGTADCYHRVVNGQNDQFLYYYSAPSNTASKEQ